MPSKPTKKKSVSKKPAAKKKSAPKKPVAKKKAAVAKNKAAAAKKKPVAKKDEKKYVPTAKALEQVAESVSLPEAPDVLARPASPPRLTVVPEETTPSS